MLRRTKKHQKKLARLVLATLLFTGAAHGLMSPSVAEAAGSVTVTGYASGAFTPDGSMIVVPGSEYGYYKAYPDETGGSVNVLNLKPGEADTWESGNYVSVYGHNTTGAAASASGYTVNMAGAKAQVNYLYGSYAGVAHGANSEMAATASGNTVTVSEKAAVSSYVFGGSAYAYDYGSTVTAVKGTAANNEVTISGATVGKDVYGGYAYAYAENYYASNTNTADASGNTVTISGTTDSAAVVGSGVTGGYAYAYLYAYAENSGTVVTRTSTGKTTAGDNTVTISGAADVGGSVVGGSNSMYVYAYAYYEGNTANAEGTSDASGNTVIISGSADSGVADIDGSVTGGSNTAYVYASEYYGQATARENAKADSNTVTIGGADVGGAVYGGYNYNYAYSICAYYNPVTVELTAGASENEVTISGAADSATVVGSGVYGGYNYNTVYYAYSYYEGGDINAEVTANADSNTVTVSGAVDVDGAVYGGYNYNYAYYIYAYYGAINVGVTGSASENEVTITSDADVGGEVYGGYNYTKVESVYSYYAGSEVNVELTAAADNNKVAIDGAAVGAVYGGYNYNEAYYVYPYDNGATGDIRATATADNNTVTVKGASSVEGTVYGGYSPVTLAGYYGVSGITTIAAEGTASENVVTISEDGGEEVSVTNGVIGGSASVYAYYGTTSTAGGTASGNEVTISGKAAVGGTVYGGYAYAYSYAYDAASADHTAGTTAEASNNTVTVSGNAVVSGGVYGGQDYSYAYAAAPGSGSTTDTAADAAAGASHNTVTISGSAEAGSLYGGEAYASAYAYYGAINTAGATAEASYNEVIISGNAVVDGGSGYYYTAVYGGEAYAGAYAYDGATNTAKATAGASHNTVTISDNAEIKTHNTASSDTTSPYYSYVTINGGVAYGYAYVEEGADNTAEGTSSAIENTVTISGNAAVGADATNAVMITGGIAYGNGAAKDNAVTVSGGTVGTAENARNNSIVGGAADGEASGNKVTIEGETTKVYAGAVIGGGHSTYYAYSAVAGAKAVGNSVTVSAEGAEIGLVYGGRISLGDASENTVTLTAGSVTGNVNVSSSYGYYYGIAGTGTAAVAGGYTDKGDATLNTVEIKGITVRIPEEDGSDSPDTGSETGTSGSSSSGTPAIRITKAVVGGYAGTGNATDNTVKLTDATITGGVYGGANKTGETASAGDATGTGESGGSSGESSASDVVTGNTLVISGVNTVDGEVTNFETIKLADSVEWNTEAPVLKAGQFTDNADGTRAALDITDAQGNLGAGTSGRMTLLASETADDFAALTLITSEGKADLSETNPYKSFLGAESSSTDKGVAVISQEEQRVSLDTEDSYKNVYVTAAENRVKKISLDAMTWNTGRDLEGEYIFDNTITIDATNLAIGDVTTALKTNDSMTLVSNATGLTSANMVKNGSGRTVGIDYTDSGSGIKYAATASGNVTAGTGTVTYTVDSVAADKITLASRAWGAAADEMPETWKASASTQVDAAKFAYTGEATTALKKNDTATILNASGLTTASPVTEGADKTVAVNYTDTSGINFAATANGHVAAAKNAVNYVVDGVEVNSVNLAKWNGTDTSAVTEGWTGSGVAVTGSFTAPTDLAAGSARDIVTAIGGFFTDDNIDEAIRYGQGDAFRETENNVTVAGHKVGGVKAEDEGAKLAYYAMEKSAETMTFGKIAFAKDGIARDLKNAYVFDSSSVIDATDLTFTETTEVLNKDDSMTLAANAMGITEKNVVTQPADPDVPIAYTDSAGIKFGAAASGTVEAAADAVNYVVDSVAVNSIDLAGWSGTVSAVTAGWTLADGAAVETDGMTAPTLAPGKSADILTGASDGFFANATVKGENKYQATMFNEEDSGITFKGTQKKGVKAEGKSLVYVAAGKIVDTAAMSGEIAWNPGGTYYENTKYDFTADSEIDVSGVKFTTDADPLDQSMTLIGNADGTVKDGTPEFTVKLSNTVLETTAAGEAAIAAGNLEYKVTSVTLNKVTVNGAGSDVVPEGWSANSEGVAVDTDSMTVPTDVGAGEEKAIISGAPANAFSDDSITGANAYAESDFTDASNPDDTSKGVSITGAQGKGVKASDDGTGLVYAVSRKEVSAVDAGATEWQPGATLLDGSSTDYDYSNITSIGTDGFDVTFDKPEEVAAGESMTLLKANETLADMAAQEKTNSYSFEPVSGVTVDAGITASLEVKDGIVTYTPSENKASKLTFGDVLWNADAPMLTRPDNIVFAGADVDTSAINFTNVIYLDANQQMTLVSGFGDSVGTITGGKYMVGTAFIGEGEASLSGSDLIFTTTTEAGLSEQTHKTVMAMDAGLAMLKTGNEFVGRAMDGLADVKNAGRDGISTFAAIGGGASRYNTGSHVNTHTWNAVVGVGKISETKNGSMEWGVFGEYGKGSYTVHSAVGDGDGDAHYAGGGLLAKWTNKHDVYTEASVRAGRLSDSSSDIMQDSLGNKYGYNVHANYYGGHIGVGKIINYKGGRNLDVYGKFFYLKREGVEYDAPQQYNLDSVASSILRLGARYGTTDKKWNWYGGLAYEYEFDGEATGTVKGKEIRAASIKGSSVRGEFGMRMDATKTNPWSADISLYGYGGKHRGFGGNVSVMYTF